MTTETTTLHNRVSAKYKIKILFSVHKDRKDAVKNQMNIYYF